MAVAKKLTDAERPFKYAELNLDGRTLRYGIGTPACRWRVQTLFTKEPGTIDWIGSFAPGEVFVDVGANIGIYSLYAGVAAGAEVYAFEPESQNYAELYRNIFLNEAQRSITAYCAAISDQPVQVSSLLLRDFATGYSFHDFGEPSRDYAPETRFRQGSVAFSIDHLVESGALPPPAHVKIDVDGHEHKVIGGMRRLLERGEVRSVLLECDPSLPGTRGAVEWLLSRGWQVNPDQLRLSREGLRPAEPVMEELRQGTYFGNIVFGRRSGDLEFASRVLERFSPAELEIMRLPA